MEREQDRAVQEGDLMAGTSYRSLRELGRGAMGVVLECENRAVGKIVAVKLLLGEYADHPKHRDRLRIEAQIGRLEHPNLVEVFDFAQTPAGHWYIVMERLQGRTLQEEQKARGFLPVDEAIEIACQVLEGLAAAHEGGIIHRDVKPANIFLCNGAKGNPRIAKLLDFGVAKLVRSVAVAPKKAIEPLQFPTQEGAAIGSPKFWSPEASGGKPIDHRADLYSLGLVLYALVAGRGPFDHRHGLAELGEAHSNEIPEPPSKYAMQPLPRRLDAALLKALQKRPQDRYPDAPSMIAELRLSVAGLQPSELSEFVPPPPAANIARVIPLRATNRSEASAGAQFREEGAERRESRALKPAAATTYFATEPLPAFVNPRPDDATAELEESDTDPATDATTQESVSSRATRALAREGKSRGFPVALVILCAVVFSGVGIFLVELMSRAP